MIPNNASCILNSCITGAVAIPFRPFIVSRHRGSSPAKCRILFWFPRRFNGNSTPPVHHSPRTLPQQDIWICDRDAPRRTYEGEKRRRFALSRLLFSLWSTHQYPPYIRTLHNTVATPIVQFYYTSQLAYCLMKRSAIRNSWQKSHLGAIDRKMAYMFDIPGETRKPASGIKIKPPRLSHFMKKFTRNESFWMKR